MQPVRHEGKPASITIDLLFIQSAQNNDFIRVNADRGGNLALDKRRGAKTTGRAIRYPLTIQPLTTPTSTPANSANLSRLISDLVEIWHKHHGINLKASNTISRLRNLCAALGNPVADQFKAELFSNYRAKRLKEGISANNLNREHAYLRAVFNELKRLGFWQKENPLNSVRQFKISERELSYLTLEQIQILLNELSKSKSIDTLFITKICLSTGARWSEAEELRVTQIRDGMIHFTDTKSGKNRSVPIEDRLFLDLVNIAKKSLSGRLFKRSYDAFREGIKRIGLDLPQGQLTHVLRHSFASHFMINGGNILILQKLLGHSSLAMTMRYAHLAPGHLQEAKKLNPLARLTVG
jgi:integrase